MRVESDLANPLQAESSSSVQGIVRPTDRLPMYNIVLLWDSIMLPICTYKVLVNTVTVLKHIHNQEQEKTLSDDAPGAKRRKDATREESETDDNGTLDEPSAPNTVSGIYTLRFTCVL